MLDTKNWLGVSLKEIEEDHQDLSRIVDDLEAGLHAGCPARILGGILGRIADYAGGHFRREELLMRLVQFPGLDSHKRDHDAFMDRLALIIFEFETGYAAVVDHAVTFLRDWFENHLRQQDAEFGVFLQGIIGEGAHAAFPLRNNPTFAAA